MRIGELSRHSGCDVETIRYYEREGLLARTWAFDGERCDRIVRRVLRAIHPDAAEATRGA